MNKIAASTHSLYAGKEAILTTKHGKLSSLALPLKAAIGLNVSAIETIDTDKLGTFSGEIERTKSARETVVLKARLGMYEIGVSLGIATEGSFGPHPVAFFIPGTEEVIGFIDENLGIEIIESHISTDTNYSGMSAKSIEDLEKDNFLAKALFPSHALIVKPQKPKSGFLKKLSSSLQGRQAFPSIFKGIQDTGSLREAIELAKSESEDGIAAIETDMRAHMNPTRRRVIRKVAAQLGRRLRRLCPECSCPGWGKSDAVPGLPCELCRLPTRNILLEVYSCPKCTHKEEKEREDGLKFAYAGNCDYCNP
ncbi:MAG TPA: hypothetical protein PKD05_12650 [Candidatus Melainabacteria bacterium]|nr:hypothetical protein [Candidatus Melainabacteria bacterium]HMP52394.1 hypothetical protein [Candidatus Melainabacteria bacterium]